MKAEIKNNNFPDCIPDPSDFSLIPDAPSVVEKMERLLQVRIMFFSSTVMQLCKYNRCFKERDRFGDTFTNNVRLILGE